LATVFGGRKAAFLFKTEYLKLKNRIDEFARLAELHQQTAALRLRST
jgi:hypothetical protein